MIPNKDSISTVYVRIHGLALLKRDCRSNYPRLRWVYYSDQKKKSRHSERDTRFYGSISRISWLDQSHFWEVPKNQQPRSHVLRSKNDKLYWCCQHEVGGTAIGCLVPRLDSITRDVNLVRPFPICLNRIGERFAPLILSDRSPNLVVSMDKLDNGSFGTV